MRYHIEQIFKLDYAQYQGKNTNEAPKLKSAFDNLKNDITPLAAKENLLTESSIGHGSISKVPWVRVYDEVAAPSAKNGVYIVYLFSKNCDSVFLTLNQGVENSKKELVEITTKKIQQGVDCRDFIPYQEQIKELGKYQNSTIFFKKYDKFALPSEEEMQKDLSTVINIYKDCLRMGKNDMIAKEDISTSKIEGIPSTSTFISNKQTNFREYKEDFLFFQKIFFGAPGTGKSHKIGYNLFKDKDGNPIGKGINEIPEDRKFRTTFHPDYDYAQFVGAYKPKKEGEKITYSFVPQIFAKAYATAWKQYLQRDSRDSIGASPLQNDSGKDIQVYLVIEEINRGNCAQIFGDIFQLLDRDGEGFSQYSIDADCDFAEWLKEDSILKTVWSDYETKVGDGKLKLPPNLNILATMNTSDQSLFPMDSAFKRRFDWVYVPISFDGKDAANYQIDIDGSQYSWQNFVEAVNDKILDLTESEDKQLGEFFIKPDSGNVISKERFLGKVMFYLWNEVCKDEHKNGSFFRVKNDGKEEFFTFQDLYKKKDLLKLFMDELLKKE